MSISKPRTGDSNPAQKRVQFKNGSFQYYDKEKGEDIVIPLPIEFIPIDELSAVAGWHEKSKSGIRSNEVADTTRDELVVSSWKGDKIAKGIYQDIRADIIAEGGKYEKAVYAILNEELVRFSFVGSKLSAWIEKDIEAKRPKYTVKETKDCEKGATKYKIPVFELSDATEEEWAAALKIDGEVLQPFFATKKIEKEMPQEKIDEAKKEMPKVEPVKEEVEVQDLPF